MKKFSGFTLAEVLIVLGIIGIIAEMTIPTLMQNFQEKVTVTQLKKAYSTLSQAYTMSVQENGTPDNWGITDNFPSPIGAVDLLDKLTPYLKTTKICKTDTGCFPDKIYTGLNKTSGYNFYSTNMFAKAALSDGSIVAMIVHNHNCENVDGNSPSLQGVCGDIWVDVNGFKSPNQYGIDMFLFWITKSGIIPMGTAQESNYRFDNYCNMSDTTTSENGVGCAAWVIYNENMDYLHCNDLNWTSKIKCN